MLLWSFKLLNEKKWRRVNFAVKTEKVGFALRNPELILNKSPKQLSELVFPNGTQFGTQDSSDMNMQAKTQIVPLKICNNGSNYLQEFTNNVGPTAKNNHTTTILTKTPTI